MEKDKSEFEIEINKFKEKIKQEAINLIEEKIDNSKSILKDLIIDFYNFSKLKEEEFKTCTEMELESIIENSKANFPTVDGVIEKCNVVYEYPSIEVVDISNKEFCKKLVIKVRESDKELTRILDLIIKS